MGSYIPDSMVPADNPDCYEVPSFIRGYHAYQDIQPVIQAYSGAALQPKVSSLALQVPSIGTTLPLAPVSQAQLGRASLSGVTLPITIPLTAALVNTILAMLLDLQ